MGAFDLAAKITAQVYIIMFLCGGGVNQEWPCRKG
jgi:hypothetical protein